MTDRDSPPSGDRTLKLLAVAVAVAVLAYAAFQAVATAYRAQNCVYVLGHWLSLHKTTIPLFCQ